MIEKFYVKRTKGQQSHTVFRPGAPFPAPDHLVIKIERTVESCRLIEHLTVTDRFFATVLQRALREGYYSQREVTESMSKLRALIDRRYRILSQVGQNFG